jgi:hypothetical protein
MAIERSEIPKPPAPTIISYVSGAGWAVTIRSSNNPNKKLPVAAWGFDASGNASAFIKGDGAAFRNKLVRVPSDDIHEIHAVEYDNNGGGE